MAAGARAVPGLKETVRSSGTGRISTFAEATGALGMARKRRASGMGKPFLAIRRVGVKLPGYPANSSRTLAVMAVSSRSRSSAAMM